MKFFDEDYVEVCYAPSHIMVSIKRIIGNKTYSRMATETDIRVSKSTRLDIKPFLFKECIHPLGGISSRLALGPMFGLGIIKGRILGSTGSHCDDLSLQVRYPSRAV